MTGTAVKICGLTRAPDAEVAVALGAEYVGVIFAGGPRHLTPAAAAGVLAPVGDRARRVGVFATDDPSAIADAVAAARLDVVQLHGPATPSRVAEVRACAGVHVWVVARVDGARLPEDFAARYAAADALVLDAKAPGALGGTGTRFDWDAAAVAMRAHRGKPLVVAGGLTAATVRAAIATLAPAVVDVSSGVESAPGVKDPGAIRAFVEAVRG